MSLLSVTATSQCRGTYELLMVGSTITDPNRLRVLVSGQMVESLLLEVLTTVDGVYAAKSAPNYQVNMLHTSAMTHPSSIDQHHERVF